MGRGPQLGMGAAWLWIALLVFAQDRTHGALREDLEGASPGNLKVLMEFDAASPWDNSVTGREVKLHQGEITVHPGADSSDTGFIRFPGGGGGWFAVQHGMGVGRAPVNRYTIMLDVSIDVEELHSWTPVLRYNWDFDDARSLLLHRFQEGDVYFGMDTKDATGFVPLESQVGVFHRLVVTGSLNNKGTSRMACYLNGRLLIDASGSGCQDCKANGPLSLSELVEIMVWGYSTASPARLTTVAFWDTDLTEEAIIALGPPSIGAADSLQCAAMDLVGAFLTRRSLPPEPSAPGVAVCGERCCRGSEATPCREIEMRWAYNAGTGACEPDPMRASCGATAPRNVANVGYWVGDPVRHFGIHCTPLPSMDFADEPVLGLVTPNFGVSWPYAAAFGFFAAVKYFLAGHVIPVDEIHPTLRGVLPVAFYLYTVFSTVDETGVEIGVWETKFRELMAYPDPLVVPVSIANLSRDGTFFHERNHDFDDMIRGPFRPPVPVVTVTPGWEEVCDGGGRAALMSHLSGAYYSGGFVVGGRCVPTTVGRLPERDVSGGIAAKCKQWELLFTELGVVKFGYFYQRSDLSSRFVYLDALLNSCFKRCAIQSETLDSELNGTCLQDSVELCSSDMVSSTCLKWDAALRRMKSGIVAGATHTNDIRVLVFGIASMAPQDLVLFFDTLKAEDVTGGRYQLLFPSGAPDGRLLDWIKYPGYADVLDGAIVTVESCDGQQWDDFAAFLTQLKSSDFPEDLDPDMLESENIVDLGVEHNPHSHNFARLSGIPEHGGGVVDANLGSTVDATLASLLIMNHVLAKFNFSLHRLDPAVLHTASLSVDFSGVCGGPVSFEANGQRPGAIKMKVYSIVPLPAGVVRRGLYNDVDWRYEFVGSVTESAFARAQPIRFYNGSAEIVPHASPYCEQGHEALDDLRCHRCKPGFYSNKRGRYLQCLPCELGTFSDREGSVACSACKAGTVAPAEGLTACEACAPGRVQPAQRKSACIPCGPGTFMDAEGAERCTSCPRGLYQELEGQDHCEECSGARETPEVATQSSRLCRCPSGTYENRDAACVPCPITGLLCPGGESPPVQAAGYKAMPAGRGYPPLRVVECRDELSCPGGLPMGECPESRIGMACDRCQAGYMELEDRRCQPCEKLGSAAHAPLLFGIAAFVVLLLLGVRHAAVSSLANPDQSRLNVAVTLGLVVQALQTIHAFATFSIKWIEPVAGLQRVLAVFTLDFFRLDCTVDHGLDAVQYILTLLAYPGFALLLQLAFFLASKLRRPFSHEDKFNTQGTVLLLAYLPLLMISLKPWQCNPNPDGTFSVKSMPNVQCWNPADPAYMTVVIFSFISFFCFCLGYIALAGWAVVAYPSRVVQTDGGVFIKKFRFLFRHFTTDRYYYVLIHMARSLAMALVPLVLTSLPRLQLMLVQVMAGVTLWLQAKLSPWRTWVCNTLDAILNVNLLLIVGVGLLLGGKQADDNDSTAQICLYIYLCCILVAAIVVGSFYGIRVLFPRRPFAAFLCHHKAGAGCMARWFKIELESKLVEAVFLDSDNLHNLDTLFHMIATQTRNLVVLLTRDILLRPWCAGEMATSVRVGVNIVPVACGDFLGFTDDIIDKAGSTFTGGQVTMLSTLGVSISMIKEAYWHIGRNIAPLPINRSDPYIVHEQVVDGLVKRLEGVRRVPLSVAKRGEGRDYSVLILGGRHHEAISTCHVIRMLLQQELQQAVGVLDCPLDEAVASMTKSVTHVIAVLFAGLLQDVQFAQCLSLFGASAKVRAVRADDAFAFPDEQFWCDLSNGLVLNSDKVDLEAVSQVYTELFKVIATVFTPHASSRVQGAEIREIITRMSIESPKDRDSEAGNALHQSRRNDLEEGGLEEEERSVAFMPDAASLTEAVVMPGFVP